MAGCGSQRQIVGCLAKDWGRVFNCFVQRVWIRVLCCYSNCSFCCAVWFIHVLLKFRQIRGHSYVDIDLKEKKFYTCFLHIHVMWQNSSMVLVRGQLEFDVASKATYTIGIIRSLSSNSCPRETDRASKEGSSRIWDWLRVTDCYQHRKKLIITWTLSVQIAKKQGPQRDRGYWTFILAILMN